MGYANINSAGLVLIFSVVGWLVFGVPGSIFWTVFYHFFSHLRWSEMAKHRAAVVVAMLLSTPFLTVITEGFRLGEILRAYKLLVCVMPVALLSALLYWLMWLRPRPE